MNNKEYRKVQWLVGESSFSIVLPKSFANALGIGKGDFVRVHCRREDHSREGTIEVIENSEHILKT
jgi:bifunctional DNA-binding transcriptional regulator/antitoxin component of YhaV-PrlF toxin-antitoxin module